jgi:DNA mismatch repair protein MutL
MTDIINLLPDSVANQIAAGEVIQRPASAVKELMENAIDAGATEVKLIIKDAGKGLIQVIDNGCGMSPVDARMSFARHATSKITKADDLFNIQTMGFRGEALASIAAIAQVEVKTKRIEDNIGTHIIVEGTKVIMQEETVCNNGTVFTIKNLFYNTPARRNFLKSNNVEYRHIQDVFTRIAVVNPQIAFHFFDDNRQKFNLPKGSWKQRIIDFFGKGLNHKMLNIEESTEVVNISGFIGKPETARKTRGEQYFFVNKRFIKHPYLNHAVQNAYEELIPDGAYPSYFINFEVDPHRVDVNIHPTKTEVNFQDEKAIYGLLRAAVKMTLGKFAFTPVLDFEAEMSFNPAPLPAGSQVKQPEIKVNPDYNPFETSANSRGGNSNSWVKPTPTEREQSNIDNWQKMYEEVRVPSSINQDNDFHHIENQDNKPQANFFQIANEFIAFSDENGLWLIHQQLAHERVLYDRFAAIMENTTPVSQKKLFPETIQFSSSDMDLISELWDEIHALGFMLERDQNNDIQVNGAPPEFNNESIQPVLEGMLEHYKNNQINLKIDKQQNILLSMAKNLSVKSGRKLSQEEIDALMEAYFDSKQKDVSPSGKRIISHLSREELNQKFI